MERNQLDIFKLYLDYVKETEPPIIFHRWSFIAAFSAWLGRRMYIPFGDSRLFPTSYIMLVGEPGTRKSTAIKRATRVLEKAGYDTFSPNATTKEKFLMDLAANSWDGDDPSVGFGDKRRKADEEIDVIKVLGLLGSVGGEQDPHEVFVAADEFNNFMGSGNLDFQSTLGELWDWDNIDRPYRRRLKNSKEVKIWQPTVTVLGGNTPQQFAACFPLESIGQGFMSRLILVQSEPSGIKIDFPPPPCPKLTQRLIDGLQLIRQVCNGPLEMDDDAKNALGSIYRGWPEIDDARFKHYSTRRHTHLLKLCIIVAAARASTRLTLMDVIFANTLLTYAETTMPKAVGELGKSKHSEATSKLMNYLYSAHGPATVKQLFKVVQNDIEGPQDLGKLLNNLQLADKLIALKIETTGEQGYVAKKKLMNRTTPFTKMELLKGYEVR